MATAHYSHPACRTHEMGRGHPESPQRLDAIADHLIATGLDELLLKREAPAATEAELKLAHDAGYVAELLGFLDQVEAGGRLRALDADTTAGPGTREAVLRAAGAARAATDAVLDGEVANAFCAVRPPGHHATRRQAMGFCFVNNVVLAARHALERRGLERVAIVDFDVHHGNGTEDIVANDPRILMLGFFQHPLYPGSGVVPLGPNVHNFPVPPYTKGAEIRPRVEAEWLPRLEALRPQMLFVSAGFDAHRDDDLGQMGLVEADYAWMTRLLMDVAERHARGRIVAVLEGGYNLGALARSVAAHLRVLAGVAAVEAGPAAR
ncbi:MAG TPA: histone deacetylase family protein [Methylibium sp.]|uniref:histone deacetylase family protein n=1 Tax=Methylibium sp. TaxID=2067992 RepID=UPI002DB78ECB|nr:histone deacetylase family protein [Methylibium sp.]HEU4459072.1 histone deacetylase family protein [Methylibium sp.]